MISYILDPIQNMSIRRSPHILQQKLMVFNVIPTMVEINWYKI